MCETLSTADWIQVIIAVASFLGIFTSIGIAIHTSKQNSKMIENSTRPYICFYKDVININTPVEYLVVKNFGASSGRITKIVFDKELLKKLLNNFADLEQLDSFSNITLMPNQKFMLPIKSGDVEEKEITFTITYINGKKTFNEKNVINLSQDYLVSHNQQHKADPKQENKTISSALQELVKRI